MRNNVNEENLFIVLAKRIFIGTLSIAIMCGYIYSPRMLDLEISNDDMVEITNVTVVACDEIIKIKRMESKTNIKTSLWLRCEGSYDVAYLNEYGSIIYEENLGYITKHLYSRDKIKISKGKIEVMVDRRIL